MALTEDDSKCPKPDIRCSEDGTECAVGCPAYDKSFTECKETSDCAQNRSVRKITPLQLTELLLYIDYTKKSAITWY